MSKELLINLISGSWDTPRSFKSFEKDLDTQNKRYVCLDLDGALFQLFVCSDYFIVTAEEIYENRVPDLNKIYVDISSLNSTEQEKFPQLMLDLTYQTDLDTKNMTINELTNCQLWEKAIIVFNAKHFDTDSTIEERSFLVMRSSYFLSQM